MQCLRNSLNRILFFLLYFDAVSCFYEEKQQDEYTTAILNITFCDALKKNCHSESGDGKFGLNSPKEHVSGWLVLLNADNHNGCKSFSRTVSPELKPTIVLLIRGDCNFKDKISNAYKYNASAVVIYNNQGKDKAVSMSHAGEYHIVSVSVSQISGEKLASKLQNATVYVEINVGQQSTRPKWKVNPTSVLFVSVSFIVLMVISLAWLVFYYVQRFRYVHARDKTEKRLTSAAKKAIAKLPVRTVNRRDEPDETESCAVCLDGYKAGDQLRILPCNHEFHKPCIDPWLVEHRTCPMCKLNILKELGLSNQQENMHMDAEMGIAEAAEDHNSANDNPVVSVGEMGVPRRNSQDSSSDGSAATRTRLLISADLSWERESTSTSNLVDNSSLRT